jgi:hypothetical protein
MANPTSLELDSKIRYYEVHNMVSRICFAAFATLALVFSGTAQAGDPYAFQFGYTQGYQNSFRNRLPTPPYFSIYPPVYYGRRYERPYGDSPYAAFPQLGSAPGYHPVPKEVPFRTTTIINPHVEQGAHHQAQPRATSSEPVATAPRMGRTIEIINPYAQERMASGSR